MSQASCSGTADEQKSTVTYNGNLLPATMTTAAGDSSISSTTTLGYDSAGNVTSVDGPLSGTADTTVYHYDADRELIGVVSPDPDGSGPLTPTARKLTYNAGGKVTVSSVGTVTDQSDTAWNNYSEAYHQYWHYDANGRPDRTTMWSNGTDYAVEDYVYDNMDRLKCSIQYMDPNNWGPQASSCTPLQTNGPNGPDRVTQNGYDATGRLLTKTVGVGTGSPIVHTTATYTPGGKIETLTDANGNQTVYSYDDLDRPSKTTYSDGSYEQLTYFPNSNNIQTRRTRGGDTITFAYDALNRLTSKTVPARSGVPSTDTRNVYYGYDLMGHPLYARFDSATGEGVSFAYNALGEMTSTTQAMDGASRTLSYQYDAAGNRTRITHPDGAYFTYNFDPLSRLSTMSWWTAASGTVAFAGASYNSLGQRTSMGRGSSGTDYTYDAIGRLHSVLQRFAGGTGNITQTFGYNPASQITSQTRDNDAYTWTDAHDTNRSYTANGLNQYSVVTAPNGTFNFTYDAKGNLTYDGVNTYTYDVENRLISRNGDGRTASLRYDPLGRLYEVVGSTTGTTRFLYDGDSLVAEYDASGTMLQRYAWGANPDELVMMDQGSSLNCSATRMAQPDERGSIIATADCWGNRQSINTYDEYGIPGSGNTGRFQYTGQAWLPDAALYYYKARMYSPTIGRFMQTDPIGYGDGMNMYRYVGNDPVNGVDPSGLVEDLTINVWAFRTHPITIGAMPSAFSNIDGGSNRLTQIEKRLENKQQDPGKGNVIVVTAKRQNLIPDMKNPAWQAIADLWQHIAGPDSKRASAMQEENIVRIRKMCSERKKDSAGEVVDQVSAVHDYAESRAKNLALAGAAEEGTLAAAAPEVELAGAFLPSFICKQNGY